MRHGPVTVRHGCSPAGEGIRNLRRQQSTDRPCGPSAFSGSPLIVTDVMRSSRLSPGRGITFENQLRLGRSSAKFRSLFHCCSSASLRVRSLEGYVAEFVGKVSASCRSAHRVMVPSSFGTGVFARASAFDHADVDGVRVGVVSRRVSRRSPVRTRYRGFEDPAPVQPSGVVKTPRMKDVV